MENLEQIFPHPEAERGKALRMVMVNEGEENREKKIQKLICINLKKTWIITCMKENVNLF